MLSHSSAPKCCLSCPSLLGLFAALLLLIGMQPASAQEVTVEGTVLDAEEGGPLPGVNVREVDTERGTITDADGSFEIRVSSANARLRFSFVGYQAETVPLDGRTQLTVELSEAIEELEGLVVTALGVEQEERALGYSVDEIGGADVSRVQRVNVAGALAGRVPGLAVSQTGGGSGGSSRLVLRGSNSLSKDNQALIVLDGVPINNSQLQPAGRFGGFDYGDGITNLNANEIKEISVLKGPNAAALYGNRADNGAVVITTKKGRAQEGIGASYNGSFSFETPTVWPDEEFQNTFGRGTGGSLPTGPDGTLSTPDDTEKSFGPRMEGQPVRRFNGEVVPFEPREDNVRDFYDTGSTFSNSISLYGGNDQYTFRASFTNLQNNGILPDHDLDQNTLTLAGTADLSDRLSVTGRATYLKRETSNRPNLTDNPDNTVFQFIQMPRSIRLADLQPFQTANGEPIVWNNSVPGRKQNPFWTVNLNTNDDERDRLLGQLKAKYDFTDWLNLQVRGATDIYTELRRWRRANNTVFEVSTAPSRAKFRETNVRVEELNYDALLSAEGNLTEDFSGELRLGGWRFQQDQRLEGFTGDGTTIPNLFTRNNAESLNPFDTQEDREINSVYGLGQIGFRDYAFLDLTARNDWSSTLPEGNRSFFYPSVSGSFILTEALDLDVPVLSYAKIRGSWAETGDDAQPFQVNQTFSIGGGLGGSFGGQNFATVPDDRPSSDFEPEETTSIEVGTDLRFLQDRIDLEFTYFTQSTENQVIPIPVSSGSGFSSQVINTGEISNNGVEGRIEATVLEKQDFQWDLSFNASTTESEVEDFPGDITTQVLGTSRSGVQVVASEGEEFGNILGTKFQRNENGEIVVDANGVPKPKTNEAGGVVQEKLGNFQADWRGGVGTTVSWKNFSLRALFDIRQGGEIYSLSNVQAFRTGNHEATLRGREEGFVFDGVKENGEPNDIRVSSEEFWSSVAGFPEGAIDERFVFDASYVRLRELTLGYQLPTTLIEGTSIQSARITFTGENLVFLERHTDGFDPAAATRARSSGVQGLEFASFPNTRSFGVNINLRF